MTTSGVQGPVDERTGRPVDPDVLLEIRNLTVDYGMGDEPVHAVDDVTLTIRRGEVVGLAGESGSGKSTLAFAITRLLRDPGVITGGEAYYYDWPAGSYGGGIDRSGGSGGPPRIVDLLSDDRRVLAQVRWSHIAVVFQSALHALNPVFRVGKLIDDVLTAHERAMSRTARRSRAEELLAMVGISADRLDSYPHQLSGGMRQRVMIALALALRPRLLIMDEPTTALDVVIQREILEQLIELRDRLGFSVLFITHDLSLLIEIADSIAVMYAGRMIEQAPAKALFRSPRHPYTYGLTTSFPSLHGPKRVMAGIPGSPPDLRHVPAGCPFHERCAFALDICSSQEPAVLALTDASGPRQAMCHLQDGVHQVPVELGRPAPADRGRSAHTREHGSSLQIDPITTRGERS